MAKKCIYCGMILEGSPDVCPICGTSVQANAKELPSFVALDGKRRRRKLALLIAIPLAVVALVAGVVLGVIVPSLQEGVFAPENHWRNHPLLSTYNAGVCKKLTGQVELFFVFVDDPKSDWDEAEKRSTQESLDAQVDALEKEAEKFGVTLEINTTYGMLKLPYFADHNDSDTWKSRYAKEQGYDSLAELQADRGFHSDGRSAPVVFLFDYPGRSYATQGVTLQESESAVLFYPEDFRHELFHLYGAADLYYHELTDSKAKLYLPGSIMNDGYTTDDLTAYAIGWMDALSEDALAFLESTSALTYADLYNAQLEDQLTGKGTVEYDGDVYTGELVDGIPHGQGTYTFADGSVYEGSFEAGYFHGYGIYTNVVYGYCYAGDFQYGQFHGQGVMTSDDGTKYTGEFKNDQCHGQGIFIYGDGSIYKGDFAEGYFHGIGEYYDAESGSRYKGEFENDLFNGEGTLTFGDGDVYVGTFKDDLFDGQGTYTFADGRVYEGQFKRDEFHGQGTMTYPDGTVESGTWFDGKFVG